MADGRMLVFDTQDELLKNASLEASKSNCILPLLKLEIRCKIEQRLLERGEDNISIPMSSPPKKRKTELTKEEIERLERRKEQNKKAAKRFRQKEKIGKIKLDQILKEQREKNEHLRAEIKNLETEKDNIIRFICTLTNET